MAEPFTEALNVRFLPSPRLDKDVTASLRRDLCKVGLLRDREEPFSQRRVVYLRPADLYIHAKFAAEAKSEDRQVGDFGDAEAKVGFES